MNIEKEKNNKGIIILVILLVLLSVGLGVSTFYFYDLNSKKVTCKDDNTTNENTSENLKVKAKDLNLLTYFYDFQDQEDIQNIGTYIYDGKEYKLSIERLDEDYELSDGSIITEDSYILNINDKKVPVEVDAVVSVHAFDYDTSLIYINGIGSFSYDAAAIIDIKDAKLVKHIEGGYITGNRLLTGEDWDNYQTYSVCTGGDQGKYSIRGFNLDNLQDDILIYEEIDAHCFQEN